ncbi:unnamed protein product [Sphagnum jensenii]|uniref:Uncharacterized protein n=1 Tax=Sphagnum jensenii TaxID=128206 RepID=A0ABP1BF19_9BRYO
MGCSSSKVENEELVSRCRARKRFLKQAVYKRHAFAASHAQYVVALKGAGSAFRQFAEGEVKDPALTAALFLPETLGTPHGFELAPIAMPPPPPPMSPTISPVCPTPPPPPSSPPRLELPQSPQKKASPPPPAAAPPPKKTNPNGVPNGILKAKSKETVSSSKPNRFPETMMMTYSEQQDHQQQRQDLHQEEPRFQDLNLNQLEEDIPELEDVDDEDDDNIDGPPPKDSDDEEELTPQEVNPIVKKQPETSVQQQAEVLPKPEEVKENVKVDEEKASNEIVPVAQEKVEKGMVEATKKELAVVPTEKSGRDLLEVLKEVDDFFLRAADSGEKVSQMLETKKLHYHSSFSDSFRARMLNASFRKLSSKPAERPPRQHRNGNHITYYSEESASISSVRSLSSLSIAAWTDDGGLTGSHASTLDRLYAWEKKLHLEVKEAEVLRIEFEKKCAVYRNQDARGEDQQVIDRTRANIKMLQTRMAVAVEAVESAAAAVQRLRDDELYPQLLELLEELMNMWKVISNCHQSQMKAVEAMRRLDNSAASEPTTSSHRHSTAQLEAALMTWVESLSKLVTSQREYLKSLTGWIRLSLFHFVEPERNGSQSPDRSLIDSVNASPIYALCQQWQTSMDQMPDKVAIEAIAGFAAVVREMLRLQYEELRIKKKVEFFSRELEKREFSLHSSSMRELSIRPPPLHSPIHSTSDTGYEDNFDFVSRGGPEVTERWQRMEASRRRLEEEVEAERKAHIDTRAYTLNSLQTGLPTLFQALVTFSNKRSNNNRSTTSVAQQQQQKQQSRQQRQQQQPQRGSDDGRRRQLGGDEGHILCRTVA